MIDPRDLRLDTADQCLAALAALLSSGDARQRRAALTLLAEAAPPSLEAPLAAVATKPDADGWDRSYALRALHRMDAALPEAAYRRLLGDAAEALGRKLVFATEATIDPVVVVLAATTPALVAQCLAWVEGISPRAVPRLLEALVENDDVPPAARDALAARWLAELPEEIEACDLQIACGLGEKHDGALDLLHRHWRARALCGDPGLVDAMERVPALARRLSELPAVQEIVRAELLGPTGGLVDALGELPFARRLRNAVLQWSARELPPRDPFDPAPYARYQRALTHLASWAHGAVVVVHLVREARLAPRVEGDLVCLWLRLDRTAAAAWIEARARATTDPDERARLALCAVDGVWGDDRALLHRMLDAPDEAVRRRALEVLDRLEDGARWSETLRAIAAAGGSTGAAARWCLARRGDEGAVDALLTATEGDDDERDRLLARLSRLPSEVRARRGLFEAALSPRETRGLTGSLAGRAAEGLLDAFGEGARAAVVRAYLAATCEEARDALRWVIADRGLLRGG